MALPGRKTTPLALQEVITARGAPPKLGVLVSPTGSPVVPSWFTAEQKAAWKKYIVPAYWLRKVDEPKAVMFIHFWVKYESKRGEIPITAVRLLSTLAAELGFDPVARQRMSGQVLGRQERRRKGGGGKDASKKEALGDYA